VLVILAVFSVLAGFLNIPENIAHASIFSDFLSSVLPAHEAAHNEGIAVVLQVLSSLIVIAGIYLAFVLYKRGAYSRETTSTLSGRLRNLLLTGFGFDYIYNLLFIRPLEMIAEFNRKDFIDRIYTGIADFFFWINRRLVVTQSGRLNWYLAGITFGAIIILTLIITL